MAEPIYPGCVCSETTLRFNYCKCGARKAVLTAEATAIILDLTKDQMDAMTELHGAIPLRTANHLGYGLEKLGLTTGFSRSGDNACILTDLGEITQKIMFDHKHAITSVSN